MARTKNSRTANGSGNLRKRADGSWEARFIVGYDPGTGNAIRKSVYAKTQKEARQKMTQAIAAIDNDDYFEPSKLELGKWLDIWIADYMGDKKYLTIKNYKAAIANHIKPSLGAVKLSQLHPHTIQHFYNTLQAEGCKSAVRDKSGNIVKKDGNTVFESVPMSPKSIRNIHGVLTKALTDAVRIGYLRSNPADAVVPPRVEKKELAPLTDAQVKAFLKEACNDDLEIILKVILFTGIRESEALGLTWNCIDFKAGTVKICQQLQKRKLEDGGETLASTKSGKARVIKPAPFVMALLDRQYRFQSTQRLAAGDLWHGWQSNEERKTGFVFTTPDGKSISQTSIRYHFKKVAAAIGAPSCRVHDLRHTFAVLSLQNGDDIKTVQSNLGHATAAFTLDVYGHVSERMKDDSAARMQAYIEGL